MIIKSCVQMKSTLQPWHLYLSAVHSGCSYSALLHSKFFGHIVIKTMLIFSYNNL